MNRPLTLVLGLFLLASLSSEAASEPEHPQAQSFLRELIRKKVKKEENVPGAAPRILGKDYLRHEEALQLVQENRLNEACLLYEKIVLDNPEDDEAFLLLGHCYLLTHRFAEAEAAYASATHIQPDNAQEILPFFQNLVLHDAQNDEHQTLLGYAYWMRNDIPSAIACFEEALRINPNHTDAEKALAELRNH